MKIFLNYPDQSNDGSVKKLVRCYWSWETIEPNQHTNDGMEVNPPKLVFESTVKDGRSGKESFEHPNLYITFEPIFDSDIKISVQFKKKPQKSNLKANQLEEEKKLSN